MARTRRGPAKPADLDYYRWLFLLSLPVAAVFLFRQSLEWGSLSDDAWYFYGEGLKSWGEILDYFFLPHSTRVFLFGEDRPLWNLFYKTMHDLGASPTAFHLIHWGLNWSCCLGFAWGAVTLARLAFAVPTAGVWMTAAFLWWTPAALTCAIASLLDLWSLGLMGLFWGLAYASPASLPEWLRRPTRRWAAAVFAAFLAIKAHEAAFICLGWTSAYLLLLLWLRTPAKKPKVKLAASQIRAALAPAAIALVLAVLYRSFEPAAANRPEIQVSLAPSSLIFVGWHYVLMGLQAYSHPFVDWLGIRPTGVGYEATAFPWAFLLTLGSFACLAAIPRPAAVSAAVWRSRWLILLLGVTLTLPYLSMANRQLAYYPVRLNAFLAVFLAVSFVAKVGGNRKRLLHAGAGLYLASVAFAGFQSIEGWNYIRYFGGEFRAFSEQVLALPGARDCSSDHPCCLNIPGRTWGRNEWIVDWNLGAPKRPAFVPVGMPCEKTLAVP